jgi:hypothetical protein
MKKLLFLLAFLPVMAAAQTFIVSPNGLQNAKDSTISYLVLPFQGQTAEQLYNKSIKYINEVMRTPNASKKGDIKNEYVRFTTFAPSMFEYKNVWVKLPVDGTYDTELKFKDGKVKFEFVAVEMRIPANGYAVLFSGSTFGQFVIFNNKGKLIKKDEKNAIENYFNMQVKQYVDYMNKKTDDNW